MSRVNRNRRRVRRKARRANNTAPARKPWLEGPYSALPPADAGLEELLTRRGWHLVERCQWADVYEWCASYCPEANDVTFMIVDTPEGQRFSGRYRVEMINTERRIYNSCDELVADLDVIEARRCDDPVPDERRKSR